MTIFGEFLLMVIELYIFIIIISVIVSWLLAFNVISARHPATQNLVTFLGKATDPVMRPIQRYIPPIGGIDLTPLVVIFSLMILQGFVARIFF